MYTENKSYYHAAHVVLGTGALEDPFFGSFFDRATLLEVPGHPRQNACLALFGSTIYGPQLIFRAQANRQPDSHTATALVLEALTGAGHPAAQVSQLPAPGDTYAAMLFQTRKGVSKVETTVIFAIRQFLIYHFLTLAPQPPARQRNLHRWATVFQRRTLALALEQAHGIGLLP